MSISYGIMGFLAKVTEEGNSKQINYLTRPG